MQLLTDIPAFFSIVPTFSAQSSNIFCTRFNIFCPIFNFFCTTFNIFCPIFNFFCTTFNIFCTRFENATDKKTEFLYHFYMPEVDLPSWPSFLSQDRPVRAGALPTVKIKTSLKDTGQHRELAASRLAYLSNFVTRIGY